MANSFISSQSMIQAKVSGERPCNPSGFPKRLRLLIVEDTLEDAELIIWALRTVKVEFQYAIADTYDQCEVLLAHQDYNAVLADYRLPGLHAPELLQLVQKLQPTIPFILVTGSLGEESAVECIKAGMTDYVLKDSLYKLPTVLKRALEEAELKRQQQAAIAQIQQQAWLESALNRVIQASRETLILEDVAAATVTCLREVLEVDRCLMVEWGSGQPMVLQCASALPSEQHDWRRYPCNVCLQFEDQLQGGHPLAIYRSDGALHPETALWLDIYQVRSVLMVALQYQQISFGVLMVHHVHTHHEWSDTEVALMKAVAEQCAISMYQAKLYQQAQHELEHRRRIEEQLHHDAFHDELTGLPNRALFVDRLNHAIDIAHRHRTDEGLLQRQFAVLFLDLDDFRIINDSLGHNAGDFLLRIVAERLRQCLRTGDTLARTSGDEFAILLEEVACIDNAIEIAERLQNALKQPITLESQDVAVSACIGIVIPSSEHHDASQFLRDADTAMYQAKAQGRGHYQVFNGSMHLQVRQRLQLENDLRRAIKDEEFVLTYQPIIHLPSQRICGFEALMRWCDPTQGLLSPDAFIPIAEQTGLILPIGQWVLEQACRQWKQWVARWPGKIQRFRINVNLSAKQFAQPLLIKEIDAILQSTQMSGHHLRMEVTESALIESEVTALKTLQQLRARRIQVLLDDFGTGYSSLSYLLRFPKDGLKIDKTFVSNLENSAANQEIIKTIISLGSNLGLDVVGEGIETASQARFLLDQGCLLGQGYYFSEPLTSDAVAEILEAELETHPQ